MDNMKRKNIIICILVLIIMASGILNLKVINIFYAIDTENMALIKTILFVNPNVINKKYSKTEFSRCFVYTIPLIYASERSYPKKDIIMYLLPKTYKYYQKKNKMDELNIIIYNVFCNCLVNAYMLNPMNFKDYPDFDIPDKILELGFDTNYQMNKMYGNIRELINRPDLSSEENRMVLDYFITRGINIEKVE